MVVLAHQPSVPRKWSPQGKHDRYEPFLPLEQRIERVRRRFAAGEHYQRRLAVFDRACPRIDREAYRELQHKHEAILRDFDPAGPAKYLDVVYWLWHKTDLFCRLDLDVSPPVSVLDIGMGGGHFSFLCETYGHEAVGIDIEYPIYEDICAALHVERITHRVMAREALPDFGRRFDLVTALWIMFNQMDKKRALYWSNAEWAWLLDDLKGRLNPGGKVYLELNQHRTKDRSIYWDEAFVDACEAAGTHVCREFGRRVTLDAKSISGFTGSMRPE